LLRLAARLARKGRVPPGLAALVVRSSQRLAERRGAALRDQLLNADERLDDVLAFSGRPE
jgi:hypothetical protein